ncbi:hypothetical protein SLEP1_g55461 [Rubroshorea leprosula]|uniref:Uncharacterized protein n=1 Tax=Rubroshorea leprosula TaxID=152421 RepID=A0AAV5MGK2_9ROSI|nr:hypothetical protein SLEP1_g55461 [Rubroshorea leprosula]
MQLRKTDIVRERNRRLLYRSWPVFKPPTSRLHYCWCLTPTSRVIRMNRFYQ